MSKNITYYISRIKNFGAVFFIKYHIIGRHKGNRYKQRVILDYVKDDLRKVVRYPIEECKIATVYDCQPIWVCWWQGEENMPPIVKACFNSIKKYANGHPVNFICENNVSNYINIPPHLETKRKRRIISMAHFCDYVRFSLLSEYGGLWIDSTMLLTGNLPDRFPIIYTLKQNCIDDNYVSDYRWSSFFIGGDRGLQLFVDLSIYLSSYWQRYDSVIDYYLLDYAIAALYETNDCCRELIDGVPASNPNLHRLQPLLNSKFDVNEMGALSKETSFYKLSWKNGYVSYTEDGDDTFFNLLMKGAL